MTKKAKEKRPEKRYQFIRGSEVGPVRYEPGDIVPASELQGWPMAALVAKGAAREVDDGDGQD